MTSKWFGLWLERNGIEWSAIPKGAPQQNAIVERFNRTYREDVLMFWMQMCSIPLNMPSS
jgi:putative transposase